MATPPAYIYQPVYGVEPYDALGVPQSAQTGGGAKITNQNLVRTVWSIEGEFNNAPDAGRLLKPVTEFGDFFAQASDDSAIGLSDIGLKQVFDSRYAARFLFAAKGKQEVSWPAMAMLHAPQSYRQALVGAVRAQIDDNAVGGNTIFSKSVMQNLCWRGYYQIAEREGEQQDSTGVMTFGGPFADVPLYKTDGSDGNYPEFLPGPLQAASINELIETYNWINAGKPVFVPAVLAPDAVDDSVLVTIEWPHSIARG